MMIVVTAVRRQAARIGVLLLLSLGMLSGFASGSPAKAADPSPCELLQVAEVEAVIGPLAGPPFRAANGFPVPTGNSCRYETQALRAIDISVKWKDGGKAFGLMNMAQSIVSEGGLKHVVTLSDGTELTGEWDEARVFMCCEFDALRGEQLVKVNVSGSRATIEQAAALADSALKRLDQPVSLDEAAGIAAAEARANQRPKPRPVCELLTRAEAESIAGAPLLAEPAGNNNRCTYAWILPAEGYKYQITLSVTWHGGFSEMRMAQAAMGQAFSFLESEGLQLDQDQQASGAFDEEATNLVGVMVVKKDVLLSVETGGVGNDIAQAFIAKAASNL